MKKIFKESGKAALAIVAMLITLILFYLVGYLTGFHFSEYTTTKLLEQMIVMTAHFAVLWYTRCNVETVLWSNIGFMCFVVAIGSDTISPLISGLMLAEVIAIYRRDKEIRERLARYENSDGLISGSAVAQILEMERTAIERKAMYDADVKREAAREIFEEIEKCFRENLPYTTISKFYLVELKKKYVGDGSSRAPTPTDDNVGGGSDGS